MEPKVRFPQALSPWRGWQWAWQDLRGLYATDFARKSSGRLAFLSFIAISALFWFAYLPLHEFLHAAGNALSGGETQEIVIGQGLGGEFWARFFAIIKVEPGFGGRLSRFTPGSDLGYLITDIFPYLLTPLGLLWLRRAGRRASISEIGAAAILAFTPFLNLTGDFYEMGSILVTAPFLRFGKLTSALPLRADDLFALIEKLPQLALYQQIGPPAVWLLIGLSFICGLALAGWCYGFSSVLIERWAPLMPPEQPSSGAPPQPPTSGSGS